MPEYSYEPKLLSDEASDDHHKREQEEYQINDSGGRYLQPRNPMRTHLLTAND